MRRAQSFSWLHLPWWFSLGMAGLAIDLGMLYNVKTDLQNAMDAASLAGAWKLNKTDAGITAARITAQAAANKYQFNNNPISLATNDVTFSASRDSGYMTESAVLASPGTSATIRFVRNPGSDDAVGTNQDNPWGRWH